MAKALHGYLPASDPREQSRLLAENRRLRQRVLDLEAHILRLEGEADLARDGVDRVEAAASMQPA